MKKLNTGLKIKIRSYVKNKLDISDLIIGYDIRGENLSGAIIKSFDKYSCDISNCNLASTIIGEKDKTTFLSRANISGCNFKDAVFLGQVFMKYIIAQNVNFAGTYCPFVEYQHGDFRGSNFCDTVWRFGSRAGHSAKINKDLLDKWGLIIE